jgi:hypothetical protein
VSSKATAELLVKLANLLEAGKVDGVGARDLLRDTADRISKGKADTVRAGFRLVLARSHERSPKGFRNHLTVPCCGTAMVPIQGHNAGRPVVMFNPFNEIVQCHHCGAIWGPVPAPSQ